MDCGIFILCICFLSGKVFHKCNDDISGFSTSSMKPVSIDYYLKYIFINETVNS